jgi:hypothetical protein
MVPYHLKPNQRSLQQIPLPTMLPVTVQMLVSSSFWNNTLQNFTIRHLANTGVRHNRPNSACATFAHWGNASAIKIKRSSSKFFLILTPITLMYAGLEYGLGQEWGSTTYRQFRGLLLALLDFGSWRSSLAYW